MSNMKTSTAQTGRKKAHDMAEILHKRIRLFTVIIFVFLFMVSCEDFFISEATNVNIPGGESRLVIYSFISPQDTVIRVHVYRSVPYYNRIKAEPFSGQPIVSLARKGGEKSILEYSSSYHSYIIRSTEFRIEPGHFYELSVELENGEKVRAECYVPELEYEKMETEVVTNEIDKWGTRYTSINWKITPVKNSGVNYYSTGAFIKTHTVIYIDGELITFDNTSDLELEKGNKYTVDESGRTISFKAGMFKYYDYSHLQKYYDYQKSEQSHNEDSVFVYIMQTDDNYYHFHRSYENYFQFDDGFPFAESVIIYSNIEGGLGAFGGYNRKNLFVWASNQPDQGRATVPGHRYQCNRH